MFNFLLISFKILPYYSNEILFNPEKLFNIEILQMDLNIYACYITVTAQVVLVKYFVVWPRSKFSIIFGLAKYPGQWGLGR